MNQGRDEDDDAAVRAYLQRRGRQLVDPFGADASPHDVIFAPSLGAIRQHFALAHGRRRSDGRAFRPYPFFQERPYANAFALDLGGAVHLCGMDTGMATICLELAGFVFSQTGFCAAIGDAAAEQSPAIPRGSLLGYAIADQVAAGAPFPIGETLLPIDPDRRLAAHLLLQLMMRFAWLHELFHGLNGHAGVAASLHGDLELHEMPDASLSLVETIEFAVGDLPWHRALHCFEVDADRAALWTMLQLQLAASEPFAVFAEWPIEQRLCMVIQAASLMTFLFDQSHRRNALAGGVTHPAPYLRLHNLLATVATHYGATNVTVRDACRHALTDLDALHSAIPTLPTTSGIENALQSADLQQALANLERDLRAMCPHLDPFAYR